MLLYMCGVYLEHQVRDNLSQFYPEQITDRAIVSAVCNGRDFTAEEYRHEEVGLLALFSVLRWPRNRSIAGHFSFPTTTVR